MKTVRLFLETANLVKGDTKILISTGNRMEDSDIEDILDEGFDQKSDELITLKINTIQENTGRETMDLVVLYGVLKSRLTGDVQAALFSKLGDFYKDGYPKIKEESEAWGEKQQDKIIASSTIDEYEKEIQFLVPDDYEDSDTAANSESEEVEEEAEDASAEEEKTDNKTKIIAIAASVILAFGIFLGYQMLKPEETSQTKDKQVAQASQQKNNSSHSSSSSNNQNSKSNSSSKNNKKARQDAAPSEPDNSGNVELNQDKDSGSSSGSAGSNDNSNEKGVSMDTAMADLSGSQKNSLTVSLGLPKNTNPKSSVIVKKRKNLKNIGDAIERFSSPKNCQSFISCWKKYYPNTRLDFDMYLLERAYSRSSYKQESTDWEKPAFGSADVAVIREVDKLFSGPASDFANYINTNDSEEVMILNDINSVKSLSDLGEIFRKPKCAELFATRMTLDNLKASIEYELNPNNKSTHNTDEIYAKFSDFRNRKEFRNLNNKQIQEAFVNDMLSEAKKESASVALVHSDFHRMIESIKAVGD